MPDHHQQRHSQAPSLLRSHGCRDSLGSKNKHRLIGPIEDPRREVLCARFAPFSAAFSHSPIKADVALVLATRKGGTCRSLGCYLLHVSLVPATRQDGTCRALAREVLATCLGGTCNGFIQEAIHWQEHGNHPRAIQEQGILSGSTQEQGNYPEAIQERSMSNGSTLGFDSLWIQHDGNAMWPCSVVTALPPNLTRSPATVTTSAPPRLLAARARSSFLPSLTAQ